MPTQASFQLLEKSVHGNWKLEISLYYELATNEFAQTLYKFAPKTTNSQPNKISVILEIQTGNELVIFVLMEFRTEIYYKN